MMMVPLRSSGSARARVALRRQSRPNPKVVNGRVMASLWSDGARALSRTIPPYLAYLSGCSVALRRDRAVPAGGFRRAAMPRRYGGRICGGINEVTGVRPDRGPRQGAVIG